MDPITTAVLVGAAKGLATRLASGPGQRVELKALTAEMARLRISQEQTQQVMREFVAIVGRVDGLSLTSSAVEFHPTPRSPTVGDVLMNLDEEIELLRSGIPAPAAAGAAPPDTLDHPHDGSVLEGLDEEIRRLRTSERSE